MGDYSVICAVTGLPITRNQEVIGFEVEPYRYNNTPYNRYVPKSWPVEGEYDMVGGIEGFELSPQVALVHKEVWENAEAYWHVENKKSGINFFDTKRLREEGEKSFQIDVKTGYAEKRKWSVTDYIFYGFNKELQTTDEGLVLLNMLESKNGNVTNLPENLSFIHRSAFGQLLVEKIIAGWTEADALTLYRMVCLYSGQRLTGKQISPSNQPFIEQYPDYKQRIKLLRFTSGLASRLQKKI